MTFVKLFVLNSHLSQSIDSISYTEEKVGTLPCLDLLW